MNNKKPNVTRPITARMRASTAAGRCALNRATASIHTHSINTHNNNEPSWPPHTAAMRYCTGRAEFEFEAT